MYFVNLESRRWNENKSNVYSSFAALLSAGCAAGVKLVNKDNIRQYSEDLNGDGKQEIIEADTGKIADSVSLLKIMEVGKDKTTKTIESISIPGKIKNVEFAELNLNDERKQIAVYSEEKDNLNNLTIYRLKNNNTLFKIFSVSSAYEIETDFEGVSKLKVGKPA
jgi:hypothetical protein